MRLPAVAQPLPRTGAWKAEIERFLTADEGESSRERLTLIHIYEELRALGHDGSTMRSGAPPTPGRRTRGAVRPRSSCIISVEAERRYRLSRATTALSTAPLISLMALARASQAFFCRAAAI
jgi:hypothetical protein